MQAILVNLTCINQIPVYSEHKGGSALTSFTLILQTHHPIRSSATIVIRSDLSGSNLNSLLMSASVKI